MRYTPKQLFFLHIVVVVMLSHMRGISLF